MALKTHVLVLAGVLAAAPAAIAQELPPVVPLPATLPGGSTPAVSQADRPAPPPAAAIDPQRRREQIIMMEAMLTQAVRLGAEDTARQIREVQPGLPLFTGVARAHGYHLEDYGVFFQVEIPGVQPSVAWILEALERDRSLRRDGGASRANVVPERTFDPNAAYTLAVQQRLVDAMLSIRIDLGPEEWLTVAAHDGDVRGTPAIDEAITLVLRVKGADLLDLRAGRISLEEARKRIQVREL
jgi:hypothetical protein